MLATKKNRSYFVFSRQGVGGRAAKMELSRKSRKWAIFLLFQGKKSLIFRGFWDKGWGGGRQFCSCLEKTKYERFLFCKHPLVLSNTFLRTLNRATILFNKRHRIESKTKLDISSISSNILSKSRTRKGLPPYAQLFATPYRWIFVLFKNS